MGLEVFFFIVKSPLMFKLLWDEYDALMSVSSCSCDMSQQYLGHVKHQRLFQFLTGLNDSYASLRSQILIMQRLTSVNLAYSMLVQEESQRLHSFRVKGHKMESCYKLIGFPPNYKFTKHKLVGSITNHVDSTELSSRSSSLPSRPDLSSGQTPLPPIASILPTQPTQQPFVPSHSHTVPSFSHIPHNTTNPFACSTDHASSLGSTNMAKSSRTGIILYPLSFSFTSYHLPCHTQFFVASTSHIPEPKNYIDTLKDERWVVAMQQEIQALE
ncbi:UBN2_3 domain-containing protein [Gossypium australe]|uniref:UBN2_3 domain-containing protein n=1 Tax=Gossypium australe TaxID=47621 RepID=A0A5B6VBL7_9ROSI|nr:UBN2_3 domain-containing protein [Gossypium australe]